MDNIFKTRALTTAVNIIKPTATRILDKVFSRKKRELTDRFAWDIRTTSEKILTSIRVSAEAHVRDKAGRKTVTVVGPRFSEKTFIPASDLNAIRAFGSQAGPELMRERVGQEQFDMRMEIDRTREFMAATALRGKVIDAEGNTLVDYSFAGAHTPTLTGTALWTHDDSNPLNNIRAWKKLIGQAAGNVSSWVAFSGSDAMDALLANSAALDLLKYTAGRQIAEDGRITSLAGVGIEEYFGSYLDNSGTRQDLIEADKFILIGLAPDIAAELYAPVIDLKAQGGVGSGQKASIFYSKSWEVEDPSGRWIKVESRPLPVLYRPECIIYATVI